jgi:hypothetical protein
MKKKSIIALSVFVILLLAVFSIWFFTRPAPVEGSKTITLEVIHHDGSSASFSIATDAENLRAALEQVDGLIAGEESPYGLMVDTVDGETADYGKDQSWWCLTKGGEWLDTGVDDTLIADGEHYEFTYTVG